jgi:hypothetical protein
MKTNKLMGSLVASAFLGALSSGSAFAGKHENKTEGTHYCAATCKGHSDCKGHGNASCKGQNSCDGQGWVKAKDEKECTAKAGKWTENKEAAAKDAAPAKKKG